MDTRTDFQQRGGLVSSAAEELFSKMQLPRSLLQAVAEPGSQDL